MFVREDITTPRIAKWDLATMQILLLEADARNKNTGGGCHYRLDRLVAVTLLGRSRSIQMSGEEMRSYYCE